MPKDQRNAAEHIIDELKAANSFDEANTALDGVENLNAQERAYLSQRISSVDLTREFHLASQNKEKSFHVLHVKALDDILTVRRPTFKILGQENNKVRKRNP